MSSDAECDLCGLPTPDSPPRDSGNVFCCEGCREVYRSFGELDPEEIRSEREEESQVVSDDAETAFLRVDGMHCSTCEIFIESEAEKVDGVGNAEASYSSELLKVAYDPSKASTDDVADVIGSLGYSTRDPEEDTTEGSTVSELITPFRLLIGVQLGMMVMIWYVIFAYPTYLGLPPLFGEMPGTARLPLTSYYIWLMTTLVMLIAGFPILRGAYVSIRSGAPNMDLLIAIAVVNAYVYSTAVLLSGGDEIYFDITVVVVLVVSIGNFYEDRVKKRASGLLTRLTEERIDEARRRVEDEENEGTPTETVDVESLEPGDEVVVKPGERIPIDGTVVEGSAAVDESLVTGESVPVRKSSGDDVVGGAVVTDSRLVIEVPEEADNTFDRIVDLLWDVQSSSTGSQRFADRIAAVFVPLVLLLAALSFVVRLGLGGSLSDSLLTSLSVLVVSCPCALGLATPLAVASGIKRSLDRGIVVTSSSAFETASDCDVVAFDKTGTLTTGEMTVVEPATDEAMEYASAVEQYSEHPVADAVVEHTPPHDADVSDFAQHPGKGVSATVDGRRVVVGSPELFDEIGYEVPESHIERADSARSDANVPVLVGWDGRVRSTAVVGDEPRDSWKEVVSAVSDGREVAVITGDDERAAEKFREHPGIDRVFAGIPPEAKSEALQRLRSEGRVAMVGDGTNDVPALANADLGIGLGGGTAVAADAADVVIVEDRLEELPNVFGMMESTRRRIRQNLGWALVYNAVAIPMAVAGFINPLVAALAMATSSFLVVTNSARPIRTGSDTPKVSDWWTRFSERILRRKSAGGS